jgi:hypothetical protein
VAFRPLTKIEDEGGQPSLGSGKRLYIPDKPRPKSDADKPVQVDHIRLLTPAEDIAKRMRVEDVGKFHKDFERIADEVLSKCDSPCKVLVQFACKPTGHTVKIMHQPKDVNEKPLQEMYEAVGKMDKLPVKEGTVEFQILLNVTPKKRESGKQE